jgi:CBS domain containing-hemolysin-like protein
LAEDINELFGLDLNTEEIDTIGGWLYTQLNVVPEKGMAVDYGVYRFEVTEVQHYRISRIGIKKLEPVEDSIN